MKTNKMINEMTNVKIILKTNVRRCTEKNVKNLNMKKNNVKRNVKKKGMRRM